MRKRVKVEQILYHGLQSVSGLTQGYVEASFKHRDHANTIYCGCQQFFNLEMEFFLFQIEWHFSPNAERPYHGLYAHYIWPYQGSRSGHYR